VLAFIQRFIPRLLDGFLLGYVFRYSRKAVGDRIACMITGFCSAFFNTAFFMSLLVLLFGNTSYVQGLMGGKNAILFICSFVGVNAVFEMCASTFLTGAVGLALIKNFFLVTIGYCLSVAAVAVYFGEYLLENIHKMNLIMLGVYIVIGYLIVLVAYSVLTYIQYSVQYYRAKKSVREYYSQLTELNKIYAREEKKSSGRGNAGGYRK